MADVAGAVHLAKRFFGSIRPGGPQSADVEWVEQSLTAAEFALWLRMYGPDRRHSVAIGREVESRLGGRTTQPVLAAALLHDVGKIDADLRTWGRVIATMSGFVAGRDTADIWTRQRGLTRKVGLYLRHPELGGDMLEMAGSDPLTVAWTREHHLHPDQWSIDPDVAAVLAEVDND